MTRSTATTLLAVSLFAPLVAVAQTATSTTQTSATLTPGPRMQNPETHAAGGTSVGMPPGTRGGSGVESGTQLPTPTTLPPR